MMCAVSAMLDYRMNKIPTYTWTRPMVIDFKKLVEKIKEFDSLHDQPDCEMEDKVQWLQNLLRQYNVSI